MSSSLAWGPDDGEKNNIYTHTYAHTRAREYTNHYFYAFSSPLPATTVRYRARVSLLCVCTIINRTERGRIEVPTYIYVYR